MSFFSLNPQNPVTVTFLEKLIPIICLLLLALLLFIFRNKLKNNEILDKRTRYITAVISLFFLTLYYLIKWFNDGVNCNTLPLHICFISNILCIFLCFNKSKALFNFLVFTGPLGGICSLLLPDLSLSYKFFRYYQFYICHISIIIIPLYFIVIYDYLPKSIDIIKCFALLQAISIPMGIFNEYFKTNYMFISFSSNFAAEGSVLYNLSSKFYFFKLDFLALVIVLIWYLLIKLIFCNKKRAISK